MPIKHKQEVAQGHRWQEGLTSTCVLSNGEQCFEVTKSAEAIKYENTIKQTLSAGAPSYIVKLPLLHLRISGHDI